MELITQVALFYNFKSLTRQRIFRFKKTSLGAPSYYTQLGTARMQVFSKISFYLNIIEYRQEVLLHPLRLTDITALGQVFKLQTVIVPTKIITHTIPTKSTHNVNEYNQKHFLKRHVVEFCFLALCIKLTRFNILYRFYYNALNITKQSRYRDLVLIQRAQFFMSVKHNSHKEIYTNFHIYFLQ